MFRLTISAAAASVLLVACGGGSDGGVDASVRASDSASVTVAAAPPAATPAPAPTPAAAPAPTPAPAARTLTNSADTLDAAMICSDNFGPNAGKAILLLPGATQTVESEYSWSYIPALDKVGIPWCAVTLPNNNTGELQNSSEYVTHAIRKMHSITNTKIAIVGFSQSGTLPRWSLKFFPETRAMVEDMISIAASNQGLLETRLLCTLPIGCPTSFSQIATGSKWIAALNKPVETFAGIDYTQIYTKTDDIAVPAFTEELSVSSLFTGEGRRANIATQDICPANTADHFIAGSYDPVVYALVLDAFRNSGPASVARVKPASPIAGVCSQLASPGIDLISLPVNFASKMMFNFAFSVAFQTKVTKEPELKCYVNGSC
ncbi:MAG: lipase [Pseudomonadota bacterium]